MTKQREPADVRRYREAQEAKKRNQQRDETALQHARDALTKVEKEPPESKGVTVQAHCNICDKTVTAFLRLGRDDIVAALQGDRDIQVMHTVVEGDHIWSLDSQDKRNLNNAITKGLA